MTSSLIRTLVASAACALHLSVSAAPVAAINPVGEANFGSGTFTVGWAFTLNTAVTVTDLGYFDRDRDGLVGSHAVGIWTSGGTLLTSGTVTNADALDGDFRYTDVADIVLAAGDYVVAGVNDSADGYIAATSYTTPAEVTFLRGLFASGGSLTFPTAVDATGVGSVFGGSFRFDSAVPEPSTLALAALAFAALAGNRRRKQTD